MISVAMNNKNNYLSIVKAIGIILMVVGHSGCPYMLNRFIFFFTCHYSFFVVVISLMHQGMVARQ